MNIIENLNWRYATKVFDPDRIIADPIIEILKESIQLSPSSFGLQPWKVQIIEDRDIREQLLPYSYNQKQVLDASHLLVFCRPVEYKKEDVSAFLELNRVLRGHVMKKESLEGLENMLNGFVENSGQEGLEKWMVNQTYLLFGHVLSCLAFLRIDACPMEGFQPEEYDRILELEQKKLKSVLVCPIGYRSKEDRYGNLPKVRFPKEHYFF